MAVSFVIQGIQGPAGSFAIGSGDIIGSASVPLVGSITGNAGICSLIASSLLWAAGTSSPTIGVSQKASAGAGTSLFIRSQASQAASAAAGGDVFLVTGKSDGAAAQGIFHFAVETVAGSTTADFLTLQKLSGSTSLTCTAPPLQITCTTGIQIISNNIQFSGTGGIQVCDASVTPVWTFTSVNNGANSLTAQAGATSVTYGQTQKASAGTGATTTIRTQAAQGGSGAASGDLNLVLGKPDAVVSSTVHFAVETVAGGAFSDYLTIAKLTGSTSITCNFPPLQFTSVGSSIQFICGASAGNEFWSGTAGNLFRDTSGNAVWTLTSVNAGANSLTVQAAATSATISQSDNTTNSATAATFAIHAANATGTTATGGNLTLSGGTGTSTYGLTRVLSPFDGGWLTFLPASGSQTLTPAQSANNFMNFNPGTGLAFTIVISRPAANPGQVWVRNSCASTATIQWLTGASVSVPTLTSALIGSDGTNAVILMKGT